MKYLPLLLVLVFTGCTPLLVKEPVGNNYSPEELQGFEGTWLLKNSDNELITIQLKLMDDEGLFQTAHVEWKEGEQKFQMEESEVVLKKGKKYGIMHLWIDEEQAAKGLMLITLFEIKEDGTIVYWATDSEAAEALLESGALKTEDIDDDLVITDESDKIVEVLESKFDEIFAPDTATTCRRIVESVE